MTSLHCIPSQNEIRKLFFGRCIATVGVPMLLILAWFLLAFVFRGRVQFSVWSLLVLMFAVAVLGSLFSWFMVEAERAGKQIEAWSMLFPRLAYDYQYQQDSSGSPAQPNGPRWLRMLFGDDFFNDTVLVVIDDDRQSECVKGLVQLRTVRLVGPSISDESLRHLQGLTQLQVLEIGAHSKLTDDGLRKFQKALPNCRIKRRGLHREAE